MFGIIVAILNIYSMIIIIRAVMTWIPDLDRSNPIVKFFFDVTEPVLQPIRQALPQGSGMDFSPLVVLVLISVISSILVRL